uniref:Putative radical SAM superfamily protein n=1 Tax=viral metagenome TaxID=1070528 RepID=A0A6M3LA75_9ZZZZ
MREIKKIVLIIPPSPWLLSDRDIPMMGPLYISAYLKDTHPEVEIVVCDLSGIREKQWFIPVGDMYGVTGVSPQFVYIKKIIEILKYREPDKPVIVGGVHATALPEHVLENTLADACVIGEGELTADSLVSGIRWDVIPGIVMRGTNAGEILNTGLPTPFPNIDQLPLPDRKAIDYYSYLVPRTFGYMADVKKEGSIITGRGCPYSCSFCASQKMHGNKVRFNCAEAVIDEFLYLRDEFGVEMVNVFDDTFILDKNRVYKICQGLKDSGIQWFCNTRVDCIDKDLLVEMKKSGCLSVGIGFESGSDRLLKLMNKKATIEQARECVKVVSSTGLMINGQLMCGLPTETVEDIELTSDFIRNNPEVDTFGLHMFQPFPGTDVWEHPEKYKIEIDKDTDFSDYHTIGKHDGSYHKDPVIDIRYKYLKDIIGDRSREVRAK